MNYLIKLTDANINICHFLYQSFQPFLEYLINNTNNNNVYYMDYKGWSKRYRKLEYHQVMLDSIVDYFKIINYEGQDISNLKTINIIPVQPYYNYSIFKFLREQIYNKYNFVEKPLQEKYKVLYVRNENKSFIQSPGARQIRNYHLIEHNFDLVLQSLGNLSVENQMHLFSRMSHFVCPEGSHLANVIFMNKMCRVLAIINTGVFFDSRIVPYDCWQKVFGGEEFVSEIHTGIIATKLFKSNIPEAPWYYRYNDHIIVDKHLKNKIEHWLKLDN